MQLGFNTADLRDASRTAAAVTGAFGLMDYSEVKKYATVYGYQELFSQGTAIQTSRARWPLSSLLGTPRPPPFVSWKTGR